MKKVLLPFSLSVLLTVGASAQITLNMSDFASASKMGPDTTFTTASNATYPALTASTGANLDFSHATSNTNVNVIYRVAGTGSNQWADSASLDLVGFALDGKVQSSVLASGYVQNGLHIDHYSYSIDGTPGDSIIINSQDVSFSAPRTIIQFPASNHTSWVSTYSFSVDFTVNDLLINGPGQVRLHATERDTVIGYGKARVTDRNGNPSGYMDVLQIESVATVVDSIYLNGSPVPSNLLALIGNNFTQGQQTYSKNQNYFRTGELTPLVSISFDSSGNPASATTHAERLLQSTYIPETEYTKTLNVYPNPVTNHVVILSGAPANYGNWGYELESMSGQVVTTGAAALSASQEKGSINLPASIAPGTYFLHLHNDAAQETVRTLTIK